MSVLLHGDVPKTKFMKLFGRLTSTRHRWQVWRDFVQCSACAISNRVDLRNFDKREKHYLETIGKYEPNEQQIFPELFSLMVQALNDDPEQDFLGSLFQLLELHNEWNGQFFTPYNVSRLIASLNMEGIDEKIREKGYVSVNDPACGAGALLIAFANAVRSLEINYQERVLFVAQDIDTTAALMCYIQLSLLGCPGFVIIGDTLAQSGLSSNNDVWYTPMYYSPVWRMRHVFQSLDSLKQTPEPVISKETERPLQLSFF